MESLAGASEIAVVDDLLQAVASEREELERLRTKINCAILRIVLCPLESVSASHFLELHADLARYTELYSHWRIA